MRRGLEVEAGVTARLMAPGFDPGEETAEVRAMADRAAAAIVEILDEKRERVLWPEGEDRDGRPPQWRMQWEYAGQTVLGWPDYLTGWSAEADQPGQRVRRVIELKTGARMPRQPAPAHLRQMALYQDYIRGTNYCNAPPDLTLVRVSPRGAGCRVWSTDQLGAADWGGVITAEAVARAEVECAHAVKGMQWAEQVLAEEGFGALRDRLPLDLDHWMVRDVPEAAREMLLAELPAEAIKDRLDHWSATHGGGQ